MSLGYIGEPLPKVWCAPLLTELTTPKQWKTISTKSLLDEGYTVYGANGKIGYFDQYTHEHPTIMITCRGATCGNLHISEPFSYINGNAMALDGQPTALVGLRFLYFALKARGLDDTISGSAQPQITGKGLSEVRLPLPPLAEQKVIADKLDTLLARVENTKARLERIPQILKRFRQSVLAAAVSGRLTEEWRASNSQQPASFLLEAIAKCRVSNLQAEIIAGNKETSKLLKKIEKHDPQLPDTELPKGWKWTTFMSSMEKVVDCHNKTAPYTDTGIPLIRTPDIRDGRISLTDTRFVDGETYEYWSRRCPPKPGDIIFTREAPMGEAGIIPEGVTLCMGQRMMLLRPLNQYVKAEYVLLNILSLSFRQRMIDKAVGTGVKHLRVSDVESLTYPLAPVEEQTEIVRRVDQLFAHADRIEQQVNNALARVNNLTQSILAKAFRGELTEQWRKDNPELISGENSAEALLEKIKAERAINQPRKKPRKGVTS